MMVSKFKVILCALSLISAGQSLAMENEVREVENALSEQVATVSASGSAIQSGTQKVLRFSFKACCDLGRAFRYYFQKYPTISGASLGAALGLSMISLIRKPGDKFLADEHLKMCVRCGGLTVGKTLGKVAKNNTIFCAATLAAASFFGGGVMYGKHTATKEISASNQRIYALENAHANQLERLENTYAQKLEHYESILRYKDANVQEKDAAALALVDQLLSMVQAQIAMVQPIIDGRDMVEPIIDLSDVPHVDNKADDSQSTSSQYSTESEEFLDKTATVYQELLPVLTDMVQCSRDKKTKEGLTHAIDLVKQLQQQVAQYHDECDPEANYHTAECTECTHECQYRSEKGAALLTKLQECKAVLQSFKDALKNVSCIICRGNAGGELGELVAFPCENNHGAHVIHQECLQQLMQQGDLRCPVCRGALMILEGNAPVAHPDHEIVHVLAEDGNGYEEILFPVTQQ